MKSTVIKYRESTNKKTVIQADPGRKRDPLHNLTFARAHRTKENVPVSVHFKIWKILTSGSESTISLFIVKIGLFSHLS